MKNIIIFVESYSSFMQIYIDNLIKQFKKNKIKVLIFSFKKIKFNNVRCIYQNDLEYFIQQKDPRIYERLLQFAKKEGIKNIFIPRLNYPEYLYSSLLLEKRNTFKISCAMFGFELFSKSKSRLNILNKLFSDKNIDKILFHSVLNKNLKIPKKFNIFKKQVLKKFNFLSEPIYHETSNFKKKSNLIKSKKFILYFGTFFYGKGIDILIKSFNSIKNIQLVLCGNQKTFNFKYQIKKKDNIKIINKYVSKKKMYDLFKKTELIVLPYRKTYEHGSSGVLLNAIQAYKKIIFPNIEPFLSVKKIYKIGETFKAENTNDLKKKIIKTFSSKKTNINKNDYNKYLNDLNGWDDIANLLFKKLY